MEIQKLKHPDIGKQARLLPQFRHLTKQKDTWGTITDFVLTTSGNRYFRIVYPDGSIEAHFPEACEIEERVHGV